MFFGVRKQPSLIDKYLVFEDAQNLVLAGYLKFKNTYERKESFASVHKHSKQQ